MTEIDPYWAESVEMNCIADDARSGFGVRLARYPGLGQAWLWATVLTPDAIYSYNDDTLSLTGFGGMTDVDAAEVEYALTGSVAAVFRRTGDRTTMRTGRLTTAAPGHRDPHAPVGPGDAPMRFEATFTPGHAPISRARGRMEVLGTAEGTVTTPAGTLHLAGRGHWHEQYGVRPRFAGAFTYFTLRGERLGFVGTKTERGATGFAVRDGEVTPIAAIEVGPPGARRPFHIALDDGSAIEGVATTVHAFSVAIEGGRRPATSVIAETPHGMVSGLINDWQPAAAGD